ncbi:MAG TPA: DUF2076 domain-containing protein [Stellaceae bacterium]|nr:DUF2076 domain-containing protein [Stellaceae bacterium]
MTPQERDLITALLARLRQQGNQPKDAEAEALIRAGMAAQADAPYLLVQTVLIQDLTLHDAERRIAELERQVAARPVSAPAAPASFLGNAGRGSVPAAGAWPSAPSPAATAPAPVWTQSSAGAVPASPPTMSPPQMLSGSGSGFLRQAATTAAGVAGGALLFQGIESLFGPHYGGGFLGGTPMQPGLSETVINNYYGDAPDTDRGNPQSADFGNDPSLQQADFGTDPGQDYASDQDMADTDVGGQDVGDDGNYDV